jgi:phosphate transport system substrate-binding protein
VLVYREPKDKKATQEVLKFFAYAWDRGGKSALDLDYVPLPKAVTDRIRTEQWALIKK